MVLLPDALLKHPVRKFQKVAGAVGEHAALAFQGNFAVCHDFSTFTPAQVRVDDIALSEEHRQTLRALVLVLPNTFVDAASLLVH